MHDFYLQYNNDTGRWTKTLPSIKQGNVRVYISGFYKGYSEKDDNNKVYHGIQLTELDFEPKYNKNTDDDDNDDFFSLLLQRNLPKKSITFRILQNLLHQIQHRVKRKKEKVQKKQKQTLQLINQ